MVIADHASECKRHKLRLRPPYPVRRAPGGRRACRGAASCRYATLAAPLFPQLAVLRRARRGSADGSASLQAVCMRGGARHSLITKACERCSSLEYAIRPLLRRGTFTGNLHLCVRVKRISELTPTGRDGQVLMAVAQKGVRDKPDRRFSDSGARIHAVRLRCPAAPAQSRAMIEGAPSDAGR